MKKPEPVIVIEKVAVAVSCRESVTVTVKRYNPPLVGIPLTTPELEESVSPGGRVPLVTVHV